MQVSRLLLLTLLIVMQSAGAAANKPEDDSLTNVVADPQRDPQFVARDSARHPAEELRFFGLRRSQSVVELWPGPGYWTEILAPYLAASGRYTVALPITKESALDPKTNAPNTKAWLTLVTTQGARFGVINETLLDASHFDVAPAGSADLVLTFRNLHNWMAEGYAPQVLLACFKALKPGGILGIEDHRGRTDQLQDPKAATGYVREDYAIKLAAQAGFEFLGGSEINANNKDTREWPKGVWTLPPTLLLGDEDRDKYLAIGEADNFVLKFRKPAP
jgi:predicted methyltransferase